MSKKLFCVRRRIEYGRDYFVWADTEEEADAKVRDLVDIDEIGKMEFIDDYIAQTDAVHPSEYSLFEDSDFVNPEEKPEDADEESL